MPYVKGQKNKTQERMEYKMRKLTTGEPSTLATYRKIALQLTKDEQSNAVKYFDQLIAETPNGENEMVEENETRMMIKISRLIYVQK